ncbi:16S rRNA (guanine(527)-N(7))-methyltransferase RsmG [Acidithiobacillus sp. IBUN Pt1247-S3]|uniref:16S rRNA (guanine(527)-N(7))-methyltransferase RsmG n=1 Tax=Acidithiobacillus sp. IBUN Pt1247-S3 TaxID=3166642 RepID=UPI0034E388D6
MPRSPEIDQHVLRMQLDEGLRAMELDGQIDTRARERLLLYLTELMRWNQTHNLSAVRDPVAAINRHLLDSLALLSFLPVDRPVYDIGSGAGLPGIPLAIARPQQRFVLVEPAGKRVAFLRHVLALLGLAEQVQVLAQRAEELPYVEQMVLTSRATAELAEFLRIVHGCLQPGIALLLAKGPAWAEELTKLPPAWAERFVALPLSVPGQPPRFVLFAELGNVGLPSH